MVRYRCIVGIMAITEEGTIGLNNTLPWNYPDELEHYKKTTKGHNIVMGLNIYKRYA